MIKKTIFVASSLLIFLGLAPEVLAQGFVPLAQIPGLTTPEVTSVVNANSLAIFFNNLYKYAIGFAATLAVIEIIWGGLEISTKDSVSKNRDGKERIQNAIFGLVLVLSPALVFTIINPAILNLSLNLPPLQTTTGTATTRTGSGGTQPITATDPATQCSVVGAGGVLQVATCPSGAAAIAWGQTCPPGVLSPITPITNNTDGTVATNRIICMKANVFEFIDARTSAMESSIARLRPLAVAAGARINSKSSGSDSSYPNNGSNAVQFANTCQSIGWKTCLSDRPLLTISHACEPLPQTTLPAAAPSPAKCYTELLTCEDNNFAYGLITSDMCSSSPGWVPFQ